MKGLLRTKRQLDKLTRIGQIYYQSLRNSSQEIKSSKTLFLNYSSFYSKFSSTKFRVLKGSPNVKVFNNIFYLPQYHCLYSSNGLKINSSCLYRGLGKTKLPIIVPDKIEPPQIYQQVSDRVIYGGQINAHYGHFLTESIARLWFAIQDECSPILFHGLDTTDLRQKTFLDRFFQPIHIDKRLLSFEVPVLLTEVVVPEPSFIIKDEAFENHKLLPELIAKNLLSVQEQTSQPLYFSRRLLNPSHQRMLINEYELEQRLHQSGFAICYPEKLSLLQQIDLINKHEVIVGGIGSALHNILFNISPQKSIVYFGDQEHLNTTFLMIDAIKSVNSVYIGALKKDLLCQKLNFHSHNRVIDLDVTFESLRKINLI